MPHVIRRDQAMYADGSRIEKAIRCSGFLSTYPKAMVAATPGMWETAAAAHHDIKRAGVGDMLAERAKDSGQTDPQKDSGQNPSKKESALPSFFLENGPNLPPEAESKDINWLGEDPICPPVSGRFRAVGGTKWSPMAADPKHPVGRRPDIIAARATGRKHIDQVQVDGEAKATTAEARAKDEQVGRVASLSILTGDLARDRRRVEDMVDGTAPATDKLVELIDWSLTHPLRVVQPDGSEVWKERLGGKVIPTPIDAMPALAPADVKRVEFVDMLRRPGLKAVKVRVDDDHGVTVLILNAETGGVRDGARFVSRVYMAPGTWRRFLLPGQEWHVMLERPGEPTKPGEPPEAVMTLVERILGSESPWEPVAG
jgi:hypothetical protein